MSLRLAATLRESGCMSRFLCGCPSRDAIEWAKSSGVESAAWQRRHCAMEVTGRLGALSSDVLEAQVSFLTVGVPR